MNKKYEMNYRLYCIIHDLANPSQCYTIKTLAKKYKISIRTIYNDIFAVNAFLKEHHIDKLSIDSEGYIKQSKDFSTCLQYLYIHDFYHYKLSKDERIVLASAMLASKTGYLTISHIAERLCFSRTTIIKDLPSIRTLLCKFSLTLHSHPNKGLCIEGEEIDIRLFLLHLFDDFQVTTLSSVCAADRYKIIIHHNYFKIIQGILTEIEKEYQINFKEKSFYMLFYYLIILVERCGDHHDIHYALISCGKEICYAQAMIQYLSTYCKIQTTEAEVYYLGAFIRENIQYRSVSINNHESLALQVCTHKLIEDVSKEICLDLTGDYQLYENLSKHITSIYREPFKENSDNPVFSDIRDTQKNMIQAVKRHIPTIEHYFKRNLHESEIIYIAIHFCAALERYKTNAAIYDVIIVCSAGIGTAQFIKAKLKSLYNLNILSVIPSHKIDNLTEDSADFLISTIPIVQAPIDFVMISPHLKDEDYHIIENKIRNLQKANHFPIHMKEKAITADNIANIVRPVINDMVPDKASAIFKEIKTVIKKYFDQNSSQQTDILSPSLYQLLKPDFIRLDVAAASWKDAIYQSASILSEHGYIERTYIDNIIRITYENGPYFCLAPGVAIPHAGLKDGSYKTGMSFIRLREAIPFGNVEMDPIRYVITLSAVDNKLHLKALFHLLNLLQNREFTERLDKASSSFMIHQIIEAYEYQLNDD